MPKISVIVPVYNAQRWLAPCVESVLSQSEKDFELILVDDGSTDDSPRVCDQYAARDARVRVLHKENGGLSSARNHGLDSATGDFIYFIDADDVIHHETLSFMLELNRQTGAEICVARAIYAPSFEFKPIAPDATEAALAVAADVAVAKILYQEKGWLNSACNNLFCRGLFDGLRFREGTWYEDLDFFYKIYRRASTVCHSSEITYLYRDHGASYMNNWSRARLDVLGVVDNLRDYMAANGSEDLCRAARDRRFSAYYNIFALAAKHGELDIVDRCWPVIRESRLMELRDRRVRLKNKVGALLSYCGKTATRIVSKLIM